MNHKISICIWDRTLYFDIDTDKDPLLEENLRRAEDIINDKMRTIMLNYDVDIRDVLSSMLLSSVRENIMLRSNDETTSAAITRELKELDRSLDEYLSSR